MEAQHRGTSDLVLLAPLTGVVVPLAQVPDPVFAERMVGDGLSIDPLDGELRAPCDGEIALIHASKHAVTVRHESGVEVLSHIGLDTVTLRGEGFEPAVQLGDTVRAGDLLIAFDLDLIATKAKSALTQVVISSGEKVQVTATPGQVVQVGEPVATVDGGGPGPAPGDMPDAAGERASGVAQRATSPAVLVRNPTGLHARPAATLAGLAKQYQSQILLHRGDQTANARSLTAIMGLEVAHGDKVTVTATGPDAAEAVDELARAIEGGLGEEVGEAPPPGNAAVPVETEAPLNRRSSDDPNVLLGVAASPGLGIGRVVQLRPFEFKLDERAPDKHVERRKLNDAIDRALLDLQALEDQLKQEADSDKAGIFAAHRELLSDPDLLDLASSGIDKGLSAGFAWQQAYTSYADRLAGLKNEILAGRAGDVRDVGRRVLELVTGQTSTRPEIPEGTILIAEDLAPSDTAQMDRSKVAGFATTSGGATSHVAILARSLDIPALAGVEARALQLDGGQQVILDGTRGTLRINVTDDEITGIRERQRRQAERRQAEQAAAFEEARTTDGHHVEVVANIGSADDARQAMELGAEGVGLLRSEFVFLNRPTAPTEDEQAQIYTEIAQALTLGQPLVIRTLDVGGDKPLPYLPIPKEENPFLGVRGVRVGLDRPSVLRTQARAVLRAAGAGARLHVMFPMITTLSDFRLAKGIVEEERQKLGVDPIPVGIMVEVPSVAVMAEQFAREAEFFSVGTNDLTQYVMAMDRGHPKLAPQIDGMNPAVLGLIGNAVTHAHDHGRWVGVCGGLASDLQAVPILIGLGVDELSASIPAVPAVKAEVRRWSLSDCQELARQALAADSAEAVRALVPIEEI